MENIEMLSDKSKYYFDLFKKFKMKYNYISEQTGLTEDEVRYFFSLQDAVIDEKYDTLEIYEKIKKFFQKEFKSDSYELIVDEKEFSDILFKLDKEFGIITRIDLKIKDNINKIYLERRIMEGCFETDKEYNILRQKDSLKKTYYQNVSKPDSVYNTDQQKAILEACFDMCTDDNGYVLPEHFGSGIQIAAKTKEEIGCSYEFVIGSRKPGCKFSFPKVIKKVSYWSTDENLKKYDYNSKIPEIPETDEIYKFIMNHQHVFFHSICSKEIYSVIELLVNSEDEIGKKAFFKLADKFIPFPAENQEEYNHIKILSEYMDILSEPLPVLNYSKEEVYRIVYEIAADKIKNISFCNQLVDNIFTCLNFDISRWTYKMYLYNYYFINKSFDEILEILK